MSLYTDRNWCATNSRQVPFFTSALFNIKALARIGCMPVLFIYYFQSLNFRFLCNRLTTFWVFYLASVYNRMTHLK